MSTVTTNFYEYNTITGYTNLVTDLTTLHNWNKIETVNDYQTKFYLPSGSYILCGNSTTAYNTTLALYNPNNVLVGSLATEVLHIIKTTKCLCLHGYGNPAVDPTDSRMSSIIITDGVNAITNENYEDLGISAGNSTSASFGFADNTAGSTTIASTSLTAATKARAMVAIPMFNLNSEVVTENVLAILQTPSQSLTYFGDVIFNNKKYFQKNAILLKDY